MQADKAGAGSGAAWKTNGITGEVSVSTRTESGERCAENWEITSKQDARPLGIIVWYNLPDMGIGELVELEKHCANLHPKVDGWMAADVRWDFVR